MAELDKERTVYLLNRILESELAGVVRYTHYSLLVFGHNRIPIVSWMREQAAESLTHAHQAGEMSAEGRSVVIEEYARQMVYAEELHASEVDKMLRKPGEIAAFRPIDHLPGNRT